MKGRGHRNELQRKGITSREIVCPTGSGFVIQLLRDDVSPPLITTIVKQPGQDHTFVETVETTAHPFAYTNRLYGGKRVNPETPETIISTLEQHAAFHPLAQLAIDHLSTTPTENQ